MPVTRIVQDGECLSSIGFETGLLPKTIWEAPENAELRKQRTSPHLLVPGDKVVVPDLRERSYDFPSEMRYRFQRSNVPEKLRLKMMSFNTPRANVDYRLDFENQTITGKTDQDGMIEASIPPDLEKALLTLDNQETYEIRIHALRPGSGEQGARQRLSNLGFIADPGVEVDEFREGVALFQNTHGGLTVTGDLDQETSDALVKMHGS